MLSRSTLIRASAQSGSLGSHTSPRQSGVLYRMKTPSISEIAIAIKKLFENARELTEEAELLLSHKRFARAYTLAHLASEEVAKIPILVDKAMTAASGEKWNWKDIDVTIHKRKIKNGLNHEAIQTFFASVGEIDFEKLKRIDEVADELNRWKNNSLYVSLADASKPSEVISEGRATEVIEIARRRLQQLEEFGFQDSVQTEQRIAKFSKNPGSIGYLNFLQEFSREQAVQDLIALAKSGALGLGAYENLMASSSLDKVTSVIIVRSEA